MSYFSCKKERATFTCIIAKSILTGYQNKSCKSKLSHTNMTLVVINATDLLPLNGKREGDGTLSG